LRDWTTCHGTAAWFNIGSSSRKGHTELKRGEVGLARPWMPYLPPLETMPALSSPAQLRKLRPQDPRYWSLA